MKKLFLLLFTGSITFSAFAQWTTVGNNIFNTNIGTINIGTTVNSGSVYIKSSADNILNLQSSDNTWLFTNYFNSTAVRKSWVGLNDNLTSFNINVENGTDKILLNGGNVGIGTLSPVAKLDVAGNTYINGILNVNSYLTTNGTIYATGYLSSSVSNNEGGSLVLNNPSKTAANAASAWSMYNMTGLYGNSLQFLAYSNTANLGPKFTITDAGDVGVGTSTPVTKLDVNGSVKIGSVPTLPAGYKLYVEQGILTEKVKVAVKTSGDWSDYVFAPTYQLKPLNELAVFIDKNKHLPGIPAAGEMVVNGLDVAKMDAKLLEKIEELTLYVLQLNTKLKKVEDDNQQLKVALSTIKQ